MSKHVHSEGPYYRSGRTVDARNGEDGPSRWVANVMPVNDGAWRASDEEAEAVATLFQAAPELLEALGDMINCYLRLANQCGVAAVGMYPEQASEVITARLAIKMAMGGFRD